MAMPAVEALTRAENTPANARAHGDAESQNPTMIGAHFCHKRSLIAVRTLTVKTAAPLNMKFQKIQYGLPGYGKS